MVFVEGNKYRHLKKQFKQPQIFLKIENEVKYYVKKIAIIAANGGMFDAYKVFNIATAAPTLTF